MRMEIQSQGGLEGSDYFRVYYRLDGGPEILWADRSDNFNGDKVEIIEALNIAANSVRIIVRTQQSSNDEFYFWDNYRHRRANDDGSTGIYEYPDHHGQRRRSLHYTVTAEDVLGEPVSLSVQGLPVWLSFVDNGNDSGTLSGTPTVSDLGTFTITVTASEGGYDAVQTFDLVVRDVTAPSVPAGLTEDAIASSSVDLVERRLGQRCCGGLRSASRWQRGQQRRYDIGNN